MLKGDERNVLNAVYAKSDYHHTELSKRAAAAQNQLFCAGSFSIRQLSGSSRLEGFIN